MGTVSLTMVGSFDVDENSSLASLLELEDRIGLSFELELLGLFTLDVDDDDDDNEEHFCRLCMCFKS